ncbi:MAG: permease-like cell division protein FtsX [Myxococcota bacterium]
MKRVYWVLVVLGNSALRGMQSSPVTSAVAVGTITITLVLIGSFALLVANMQGLVERFSEELQVVAYLSDELDANDVRALAGRVSSIEGVQGVEIVSPDEALERLQISLGSAELLEGLEENPLPPSLEIVLQPNRRTPEGLDAVVQALDGLPGVADLSNGQQWVEGYARAVALMRSATLGLGGVLGVAALLIVANTIRLAVYARADEIEILSLVGASRTFIRVPFLIEGTLQGAAGGALALLLLYAAFLLLLPEVHYGLELFLGNRPPRFFQMAESVTLIGGGAGLGLLGSLGALLGWRS